MRKALLVGAGGMGQGWAKNLAAHADQVTLVGWVDIREGAAAAAAEKNAISVAWTGMELERAITEAQPDFVVDVTIPEAHHDVTLTALAHGIPVIGEKPMAHSMEAARAMVAASEKSGKLYMVSQSRRYDNRIMAYRRLIEKTCGPLGILNADFYIGAHFGGFRDEMEHVLLLDMAIHSFDQARFLSGADPVSVYAEEFNPAWSWYKGAASATCLFEMANGLRFTYRGSWCAEGLHSSWECDWRTVGAHGTALWDGHSALKGAKVTGTEGFHHATEALEEPITEEVSGGIAGSLEDFLHALDTGATPMGECHDNIKSLAMVFGAVESATTGKRVQITV
ncbi:Gfo/Idh/MocA family protein [Armatimonas sp.]|uniref:Gfo/Idh/MocA family protein n=1 Tax=Armatimonas sp. TaxID=1872638 RepID=UPI0037508D12